MGDENPIRTLGDYYKPSHKGYVNTIEFPVGNNVVPLRSDTIQLVQNECSFHGLRSEDPNQHLKDFLKLVDSLDLDGENKEKKRLLPHHGLDLWLQIQIFYDHVDCITQMGIDYVAGGRLRKLRPDEAWATIERLANMKIKGGTMPSSQMKLGVFESGVHQLNYDTLVRHPIHSGDVIDWEFLARQNLDQAFFNSINTDPFFGPQWGNLFHVNEPVYRELVREFFASFEFDASPYRYDPNHLGVRFSLGGEQKEISLLELGWRVGLYYERQSRENATLSRLRNDDTVKESRLLMEFWPTIRDGGFNVGNTKVASIRDPRVKLAHRCIAMTIAGRKETTHRVTEIDLYYLYCIYTPEVACNIPYCLSKYLKGVREKNLIYGGMLVTKIARSFGLLTDELRDALSIEPLPHVFKKKSLIAMGMIMKLQNGMCVWPALRAVKEEKEAAEEAEGDEGHDGAGGSTAMYQNISQGGWKVHQARWMDQQDEQWGRLNTWTGQQDERAY
ncbi:hypothetical protein Tco_0910842 [Tanacetum coccineum]|uniref:Zinc finger, CCHC-type n=1 Tax=Tanacetum coccineum TaxID=301880 RepID=A0ABQ5CVK3_9ASTR